MRGSDSKQQKAACSVIETARAEQEAGGDQEAGDNFESPGARTSEPAPLIVSLKMAGREARPRKTGSRR
jgi:hypothetical protein